MIYVQTIILLAVLAALAAILRRPISVYPTASEIASALREALSALPVYVVSESAQSPTIYNSPPPIDVDRLVEKLTASIAAMPIRVVPSAPPKFAMDVDAIAARIRKLLPTASSSLPAFPVGPTAQAPKDGGVWEVCRKKHGGLEHVKFVREGSLAYEEAWKSPGLVLRQNETVDEGVQDVG